MTLYQILLRLFRNGKFSGVDAQFFSYAKSLGISHIWYTGVIRHSAGKPYVKGNAGSPYSIADYYDVNPYLADESSKRMAEFEQLLARTHASGLKALIDFVPNHVSPDYSDSHGGLVTLSRHDYDWTDTDKIDYSCSENWQRLLDIILFWAGKGVDGFRTDMAELVPLEFWNFLIPKAKEHFPGLIFIAETYDVARYGEFCAAGFDYLYDKSGLYDTLRAIVCEGRSAASITSSWQRLGSLQGRMLNFLENHDEQRLASPFFAGSPQRGYAALAVSALFYPCPFMLYFGQEIGEAAADSSDGRTSIFDFARCIDPLAPLSNAQQAVLERYREVLSLRTWLGDIPNYDLCYAQESEFDASRHFAFMRYGKGRAAVVLSNFSNERVRVRINIPFEAPRDFGSEVELEAGPWDFAFLCK